MSEMYAETVDVAATTIYCTRCGQAMLVAPQHLRTAVTCPHCDKRLKPWRIAAVAQSDPIPPPPPSSAAASAQYAHAGVYRAQVRNRWIAGALGVLLPGLGVHRFYMGFIGIGIIQIVVTVITFGTIGPIWGFIEGILCFCGVMRDVDGRPMDG